METIDGEIVEACRLAKSTVSTQLQILRVAGFAFARQNGPAAWYCLGNSVLDTWAASIDDLIVST